jgi:putative acetyltransferase
MVIRDALPAEAPAVRRVVAAAFGDGRGDHGQEVADLWDDVVAAGHLRASIVAVEDGEIVGHVGVSHSWLDARRELVDVLVLSPLSVTPERQRAGIGSALVAAAVEAARALGAPALFLEGSPDYYGARGFQPAREHGFLPASDRTPGPAFQVVLLDGHEHWMTGRLVYRDVWWQHDSAGLRDPALAELEGRFR